MTELVKYGLSKSFEIGYKSEASNMLYNYTKRDPDEISKMIRETWDYIKDENKNKHITSHFLYVLGTEVERELVKDISLEIVKYGLNYDDDEVIDISIALVEKWSYRDVLDLLYNTEIKTEWLNEYKTDVLKCFNYTNL